MSTEPPTLIRSNSSSIVRMKNEHEHRRQKISKFTVKYLGYQRNHFQRSLLQVTDISDWAVGLKIYVQIQKKKPDKGAKPPRTLDPSVNQVDRANSNCQSATLLPLCWR